MGKGKNAAIRQIMRERQGKKTMVQPQQEQHHLCRVSPSSEPIGIPHSVTFEEDTAFAKEQADDIHEMADLYYTNQIQWLNEEQAAEDSSSSSNWVLMEHGLENNTDMPVSWKDEAALQQLLGASLMTISSPSDKSNSNKSMSSDDVIPEEGEPNVAWNEADDSPSRSLETPPRAVSSRKGALAIARGGVNESDEQLNSALPCFPPSTDDGTSVTEAAAKSAPNGSPFSTFRQNSTNIALQETQVYLLKIQTLEEQLAEALQQLDQETAHRLDMGLRQGATTPSIHVRTPAPASRTLSSKTYRALSTPHTPSSSAAAAQPESLWERNKTLVKEIRFADQTCVELAGQKAALELQVELLQQQNDESRTANQSLQEQVAKAHRVSARAEAEADSLRQRLAELHNGGHRTASLESELHETRQRLAERQLDLGQLTSEHALLSQHLRDAQAVIDAQQLETEQAQRQLNDVATESTHSCTIKQLLQEKNDLGAALDDTREQLNSLRDELVETYESSNGTTIFLEARVHGLESDLAASREALQVSLLSEEAAKKRSEELIAQVQSLHDEMDVMKLQVDVECTRTAENVGRVVREMYEYSRSLAENAASRVGELQAKLNSCNTAVKYIEDALVFGDDVESGGESSDDDEESVCIESGGSGFDGTFSVRNQSEELAAMEEARVHVREYRIQGKSIRTSATDVDDQVESQMTSPNKSIDTSSRLSSFDGMSHVLSDEVSILSGSISESAGGGSNGEKFLQHVQWLASPASIIKEKTRGGAQIAALNDGQTCSPQEPATSAINEGKLSTSQIDFNGKDTVSKLSGSRGESASLDSKMKCALSELKQVRQERDSLQSEKDEILLKLEAKANDLEGAQTQIGILQTVSSKRGALRVRFEALQREKEEAEVKLGQHAIFPRMMKAGPELTLSQTAEERDRLFKQLGSLREDKLTVDLEMKSLTTELEEARKKNAQQLADSKSTLELVSKERDVLIEELNSLRAINENLKMESERFRLLTIEQSGTIDQQEDEVRCIQGKLQAAETAAEQLQAAYEKCKVSRANLVAENTELEAKASKYKELSDAAQDRAACAQVRLLESNKELNNRELNNRYLEACNHCEAMLVDRDASLQKLKELSDEMRCVIEAHCLTKSMLVEKDAALRLAEELRNRVAAQATEYRDDWEAVTSELEKAKDTLANIETLADARHEAEALLSQRNAEAEAHAIEMAECRERMALLEAELFQTNESLQKSNEEMTELRSKSESLAVKCSRLREYVRKLTKKCDEWENFHERESNVLQQLKDAHNLTRQKASELAARCQQRDQMYTVEKAKVHRLQEARGDLENELNSIARELANLKVHV